jgi:oxygen-dependent protoporphyrinogen oxidase
MSAGHRPAIAVIGGGITGLVALHHLARSGRASLALYEAAAHLGGKVRTEPGGADRTPVELGAEGFVLRGSEIPALCAELGLAADLVEAARPQVQLWSRGRLRPLPTGLAMGVPVRAAGIIRSRVLRPHELARVGLDLVLPATPADTDLSVAALVGPRLGRAVVERLVEPLLGGVYAGTADSLGVDSTLPGLRSRLQGRRSLISVLREAPPAAAPGMATLRGGLGRLIDTLADQAAGRGARIALGTAVTDLRRAAGGGFEVIAGGVRLGVVDAVVVATPAGAAATLLRELAPEAARLERIAYAPVSIVSLLYSAKALTGTARGTGFLACRADGGLLRACTWMDRKWPHLAEDRLALARCSMGGLGDLRPMDLDDAELADRAHAELNAAVPLGEPPLAARVARWPRAIPQLGPRHRDLVAAVRGSLPEGVVLAGAAYDGVGLSTCARQGRAAAEAILDRFPVQSAGAPPDAAPALAGGQGFRP